jgi:hypothetical protein
MTADKMSIPETNLARPPKRSSQARIMGEL